MINIDKYIQKIYKIAKLDKRPCFILGPWKLHLDECNFDIKALASGVEK